MVDENGGFIVSGVVAGLVDAGTQGVLIAIGAQDKFDVSSVVVSAVGGATGVGLANLGKKLGTLADVAVDIMLETTENVAKEVINDIENGESISIDADSLGLTSLAGAGASKLGEGAGKLIAQYLASFNPKVQNIDAKIKFQQNAIANTVNNKEIAKRMAKIESLQSSSTVQGVVDGISEVTSMLGSEVANKSVGNSLGVAASGDSDE